MTERVFLPFAMAIMANFILGASSIYWHIFEGLSPVVLVIFRVVFSLIVLGLLVIYMIFRGTSKLRKLNFRLVVLHAVAAVIVAINWGTFIWASLHGTVLESGLGYLLAPVFVMIVGALWLRDKLSPVKLRCIFVIALSLIYLILSSENLEHWVYWTIGLTWGCYTLLKKQTPLSPIEGLFLETMTLIVIIAATLVLVDFGSDQPMASPVKRHPWLLIAGLVSVTPLVMFAFSAKTLSPFNMGVLQFILPTTQLIVSYVYYGQIAALTTYVCFGFIWLALIATTVSVSGLFDRVQSILAHHR